MAKFPKWLFVNQQVENDGTKYFVNYEDQADAVDGDGPTQVATYQLVKVHKLSKRVQFEEGKRKKK